MNESGNSNNLEPQHFGNTSAVRHGAFSRRTLAPRASEIADELLEAGHTVGLDRLAAEEIGSLGCHTDGPQNRLRVRKER